MLPPPLQLLPTSVYVFRMKKPRGDTSLKIPDSPAPPPEDATTAEDKEMHIVELLALGTMHFTLFAVSEDKQHGILYDMKWADKKKKDRGKLCISARKNYTAAAGSGLETGKLDGTKLADFPLIYHIELRKPMTIGKLTHFILNRNMDDYVFNESNGCRYWVMTLLSELARQHFVNEDCDKVLEKAAVSKLGWLTTVGLFPNFEEIAEGGIDRT